MKFDSIRLIVRAPELWDAWTLYQEYFSDPHAAKYLGRLPHATPDVTLNSVRLWQSYLYDPNAKTLVLVIAEKATHRALGIMVLKLESDVAEIHFGISQCHSGKGFASEACAVVGGALKQQGYKKVWSYAHIEHTASLRVLEKAGFQPARRLRSWMVFPNLSNDKQDCLEMIYQAGVPAQ
ncbi:GNAT family N-acetyltransferase [Vibrio sp. IRLE0018]|uniref:GNAT family N-acetyltransferase n=1 Tax=Vibrio floridensis TaxID=2908007 RepID=UPI001A3217F7|nr:GNAT family N-acetyltransferase [Vibrio floridensis]MCF8778294.1 GNAT family N-acetyltransferase [Vibrio floridensis]HAS6348555.1 GNAT family N-acetyltransferase [Vibrio vulnificus]